jgi:hypothetical protein
MRELILSRTSRDDTRYYRAYSCPSVSELEVEESFGEFALKLGFQLYNDAVAYIESLQFVGSFKDDQAWARRESRASEIDILSSVVEMYNNVRGGRNALKSLLESITLEQQSVFDESGLVGDRRYAGSAVDGLGFPWHDGMVANCISKASEFVPDVALLDDLADRMRPAAYDMAEQKHSSPDTEAVFAR